MRNLTHLLLLSNELSGEIPESLGEMSNLVWLALYGNDLSGEIPATLGSVPSGKAAEAVSPLQRAERPDTE